MMVQRVVSIFFYLNLNTLTRRLLLAVNITTIFGDPGAVSRGEGKYIGQRNEASQVYK